MNKTEIMNTVNRTVHKVGFKFKKYSPEICMVAGVAGFVGAGVLACKATLKVNAVIDESKENIEKIHVATEKGVTEAGEEYTVEDSKKELTIVYAQTGIKFVKLYGPAVGLAVLSGAAIFKGHNILRTRNIALATAYAAVDKSFKEYRGRVVERFGEALDKELKYNIKMEEVEEVVTNEDGSETTIKKQVAVVDPNAVYDESSRIWYEGNPGFTKDPEFNKKYLLLQQSLADQKLKSEGHLFLNDVYEMLGFPKTAQGYTHGWIYDKKNPIGDNFVDFGIFDTHNEAAIRFVNGDERAIILNFNHDGYIIDKL